VDPFSGIKVHLYQESLKNNKRGGVLSRSTGVRFFSLVSPPKSRTNPEWHATADCQLRTGSCQQAWGVGFRILPAELNATEKGPGEKPPPILENRDQHQRNQTLSSVRKLATPPRDSRREEAVVPPGDLSPQPRNKDALVSLIESKRTASAGRRA